MKQLRGKKALITGAASGLGKAIALGLAREGVDLYLLDIDRDNLNKVVDEARSIGVTAVGEYCDLTNSQQITDRLNEMLHRWGSLDILINNAGVAFYGPTHSMTAPQWDWLMKINLLAPIQITRELLPILKDRPESHILNMCSIAGLVAGGRFAAYHTSKYGLVGFTEAIRAEYGRAGVGVTALCPGPVQTKLYSSAASGRTDRAVPTPPRWICTTEQAVARKAIKAIRRNKRMVLITPLAHLLFQLKRFAPWLIDAMNQAGRRGKLKKKRRQFEHRQQHAVPPRKAA